MTEPALPAVFKGQPWSDLLWRDVQQYVNITDRFGTIPDNSVIVDVGGNIGCAAVLFHLHYGARVYSIEAIAKTFQQLKRNCTPYAEIFPIQGAIGSGEGQADFFRYPLAPGLGGLAESRWAIFVALLKQAVIQTPVAGVLNTVLLPFRLIGLLIWTVFCVLIVLFRFKERVSLLTLSSFLKTHYPTGPIALLKIDIEGHELAALEGIESSDWARIPSIVLETHPQHIDNIQALLTSKSYDVRQIESEMIAGNNAPCVLFAARQPAG